jgi:lipooligosaccharide transport system permease protein
MIGAVRVFGRDRAFFRRIWRSYAVGSFVQPLLYLLGVGIGVGSLVDDGPAAADLLGDTSYFAFYASALLATTVMFTASQEALWPTLDGFLWSNAYRAMVATELEPGDVVRGLVLNHAMKASFGAGGVAVILAVFDETRTPGLVPAVVAAVLVALAFAMPLSAWTASRTTDASFPAILRFGVIPMFLFGGAFYPIDLLPDALEPVAWVTPLWHGVELCRGLVLGDLVLGTAALHTGVLAAFAGVGYLACLRTFDRRLRT